MTSALVFALLLTAAPSAAAQTREDATDEPLLVVQDGRYGYIDHSGRFVISPQYIWASDFGDGLAKVFLCGRMVSIDRQGNVWPLRLLVSDGLTFMEDDNGKKGFVDATGRWVIPPRYQSVLDFSEGLAPVEVNGKWGFIDSAGNEAISPRFDEAYRFLEGVAVVGLGDTYALIDKNGHVLAQGFDVPGLPREGLIGVFMGDKWVYLGLNGHQAFPAQFESGNDFSDGLAAVERHKKLGYIDRKGQVVIPFQFDWAGDFSRGLAPARQGDRSGFIDKSGRFVIDLSFEAAGSFGNGGVSGFWTKDYRQFGYVLTSGKIIWGPTPESPDHPPLFGWTEDDRERSCEGVPDLLRQRIASFPPIPRN